MSWYDPAVAPLNRLALRAAADRLGITRPVAECSRCGCALYAQDLRCAGDGLPCDDLCPAMRQLEELYP